MATQLLFSDLMAAAAVVAAASSSSPASANAAAAAASTTTANSSNNNNSSNGGCGGLSTASSTGSSGDPFYSTSSNSTGNKNYLEDPRALQLAFELSLLNNGFGSGATDSSGHPLANHNSNSNNNSNNNNGSNSSPISSSSSLGQGNDMMASNGGFYLNGGSVDLQQQQQQQQHHHSQLHQSQNEYDNVLQHFMASNPNVAHHHEIGNSVGGGGGGGSTLNNLGHHHHHHQPQQQQNYEEITLEKLILSQNLTNQMHNDLNNPVSAADYFSQRNHLNGGASSATSGQHTFNNLVNGISSMNLNNLSGGGFNNGGINETERFKKSQNMTECVPVPSSEHVAEIVGRQGCKIKALRAKTNTYIKTPVRGEEPVFVVTGRKEDVAKAKKEILSAAEHFSLIRASRKPSLTASSNVANTNSLTASPLLVSGFTGANSAAGIGDIFSSSSSGDNSPSILTKNPIGLANAGHNQITVQVRVPYRVVGLVVGPKGATIKNIQQQTHTYIVTPSRDKEPIFEVTGAVENVEIARQQIEAHIAMRTGGNSESTDNLTNYLNSINGRNGGDKIGSQDELQLLQENFGQSTTFLRKYLNAGQEPDHQASEFGSAYDHRKSPTVSQMELLMSQLYANDGNSGLGGGGACDPLSGNDPNPGGNSMDLFTNRMRIDELIQSMQKQQAAPESITGNNSKRSNESLLLGRNLFADYKSNGGGVSAGGSVNGKSDFFGGQMIGDESMAMRRQLLSNNSEDDEGVGLELQETSPPNNGNTLMKMIMEGAADENKKYMWSAMASNAPTNQSTLNNGAAVNNADMVSSHANNSSDSSCLSSASPSPTLSKFFTFQGNGINGSKTRNAQENAGNGVDMTNTLM